MATENGGGGFFAGFILGGIVGAALALLFAPAPGAETQQMIRDKGIELKDRVYEFDPDEATKSVRQTVKGAIEEGKQAAARTKDEMLSKAEQKKDEFAGNLPA